MPTPYPDKDFTQHEQWAEAEAKLCDQMVEQLVTSMTFHSESAIAKAKLGQPSSQYAHLSTIEANKCATMAGVWADMAGHLRRPRISRIENEREYGA